MGRRESSERDRLRFVFISWFHLGLKGLRGIIGVVISKQMGDDFEDGKRGKRIIKRGSEKNLRRR